MSVADRSELVEVDRKVLPGDSPPDLKSSTPASNKRTDFRDQASLLQRDLTEVTAANGILEVGKPGAPINPTTRLMVSGQMTGRRGHNYAPSIIEKNGVHHMFFCSPVI
jgi:hypothetical protein